MESLLIGILGSFIASIIYAIIAYLFSQKYKKQVRIFFNKMFNTGITYIYQNQSEALVDMYKSFKKSKLIKIMTLRGKSFLSDMGNLQFIIKKLENWQRLQFLIGNDKPGVNETNFLKLRADELIDIDGQKADNFIAEVKQSIRIIQDYKKEVNNIFPKLHNSPPVFRLIIFDDDIFVLFYSKINRVVHNQVYRCPSSSELYKSLNRYYDFIYNSSKEI